LAIIDCALIDVGVFNVRVKMETKLILGSTNAEDHWLRKSFNFALTTVRRFHIPPDVSHAKRV
jgi:hypothetical protein